MIKVENIKGKLIPIGAEDDSFWEAARKDIDKRLSAALHEWITV